MSLTMKHISVLLVLLLFSGLSALKAQTQAFTGAHIIPIDGEPIENGTLLIENGKISAIGTASEISVPDNANVTDLSGKVVMPGLVDSHSHIGNGSGGDRSSALHPEVRIYDAIDVRADAIKKARAGGITSVNVMPGSGHLMSGQTIYLKLRNANTVDEMLFVDDPTTEVFGGMKMANGTNSIRGTSGFPGTRAKSAAMVRELYLEAQQYRQQIIDADGDAEKMPKRDLRMEALVQVLNGQRIVHNHTHRHDDILTAIRLAKEFGYRMVLHHVSEGWKVAEEIAESGFPASIIVLDSPGGKMEAVDLMYKTGKVLEDAGVTVGYHTDDGITDSRVFLRSAAFGVRAGMSRKTALEAVTINNAKMMDIDDRTGTLTPGKDADFIVLSGDPLSVYTTIEQTWIEGNQVYDHTNPEHNKFMTGGMDVFRGDIVHTHHDH